MNAYEAANREFSEMGRLMRHHAAGLICYTLAVRACYRTEVGASTAKYEKWTVGWEPGCGCGAETVPCVVLDPFGGTGTTGCAALKLGRRAIMMELKADYIEIQRRKLTKARAKRGFGL